MTAEIVSSTIALAILLAGLWLAAKPLRIGIASYGWPGIVGNIVASGSVSAGTDFDNDEPLFDAKVEYRYTVGKRVYSGNMIRVLPDILRAEGAQKIPDLYRAGSPVRVFYDPADPATSILEPGIRPSLMIGMAIYLVICLVLAVRIVLLVAKI